MTPRRRFPPRAGVWVGRLTAVLLGLGLVLMHHTVDTGGHEDAVSTAVGYEHAPAAGHSAHGQGEGQPAGDHASMLLHLCLAVLAAAGVLLVAVAHGWWRAGPGTARVLVGPVAATPPARPPPLPLRLARLQVLRL